MVYSVVFDGSFFWLDELTAGFPLFVTGVVPVFTLSFVAALPAPLFEAAWFLVAGGMSFVEVAGSCLDVVVEPPVAGFVNAAVVGALGTGFTTGAFGSFVATGAFTTGAFGAVTVLFVGGLLLFVSVF